MSIRTWVSWAHVKRWWAGLVAAVMAALAGIFALHAQAPSVTLTWVAPTMNTDGTPVSSAQQPITYSIYQGPSGQEATTPVQTGVTALTATITSGLTPGSTVCWQLTATDALGQTSAKTNEACVTLAPSVPNPPGNVTVKLN